MRPRFVDQQLGMMPRPGWKPMPKKRGAPEQIVPCIVVISYLDSDGYPWLYTDTEGLRKLPIAEEIPAPKK